VGVVITSTCRLICFGYDNLLLQKLVNDALFLVGSEGGARVCCPDVTFSRLIALSYTQ
jgi:hypothetical protein